MNTNNGAPANIIDRRALVIHARTKRDGRKKAKVIREGSVALRIFTVRGAKRKPRFEVRYEFAGQRQRKLFAGAIAAEEFARARALDMANGRSVEVHLHPLDLEVWKDTVAQLRDSVKITGDSQPIPSHIRKYRRWTERAHQLGVNIDALLDREAALADGRQRHVPAAVAEFLAHIKAQSLAQKSSLDHYVKLRQRLTKFASHFNGPLRALTQPEVRAWLNALGVSAKTWNHYRAAIVELLRFADNCGWLDAADLKKLSSLRPLKTLAIKPRPYTPEEIRERLEFLLARAPGMVAPVVLVAFCGYRWSEVIGARGTADWSDIDFDRRESKVWAGHSKVGEDRVAALPNNAIAWLRLSAQASGRICPTRKPDRTLRRLFKGEFAIKPNGFRKAFISHRLAVTGDIVKVADEAGTSPAKIKSNYLSRPSEHIGRSYFEIHPRGLQMRLGFASPNRHHPEHSTRNSPKPPSG